MKVSHRFKRAFDAVMEHYRMTEEEIAACKRAVRNDFANAERSYLAMFDEIHPPIVVTADKFAGPGGM